MAQRPEHLDPPEILYKKYEARNTNNTRIIDMLVQMCERAINLLALPEYEKSFILDVVCGLGLFGSILEDPGPRLD